MSYIIIWNPNSSDSHIHTNTRGFIESFEEAEEAIEEAKKCKDNTDYRDFCLSLIAISFPVF
jgi:hypothetical protein